MDIPTQRAQYIDMIVQQGFEYIGPLTREDIDPKALEIMDKRRKGTEAVVEYFAFERKGLPTIVQWRLIPTMEN
jgi:hypothetical protein